MKPFTKEHWKSHSELFDLQDKLQKLYGLIEWRCTQEHPPGRERVHDGKWCATHAEIAEQLRLKGKRGRIWVARLLSRLHQLKLINSKRRGPPYASEYWHLSFPDPVWLSDQVKILGPIYKSKTKDLSARNVVSRLQFNEVPRLHFDALSPIPATPNFRLRQIQERTRSSCSSSIPLIAREQTQNGRKNGTPKREPVPVSPNHFGRCQFCGARRINERYCVCDQAIAAYEQRNHTGLKQ